MPGWLVHWFKRHQHPTSLALHLVGIPLTIAAVVLTVVQVIDWRWDLWWRPMALLVGGYFLQWLGHVIEGNDMGELILFKKLAGKDYVAISPRYDQSTSDSPSSAEE